MQKGSQPADGGFLILNKEEKDELLRVAPLSKEYIRNYLGASEFIKGDVRYCLWISEGQYEEVRQIPQIEARLNQVMTFRQKSSKASTREWASKPFSFTECRYVDQECIIVPSTSSEGRQYIPMGMLERGTIVSNSAFTIYDAPLWLFGILTSEMHMTWVRTVGGRLETRYRYSAGLCYNTFPFPSISDVKKSEIEAAAEEVLLVRADYPDKTLADLYDPDKMPLDLREAHERLDAIVEGCYPGAPFANDEARLECLFRLYEKMTAEK